MSGIKPAAVAIIGCGAISRVYFENIKNEFSILRLKGCCDLDSSLAKAAAERYNISAMTMDEILADPEIEIAINLTPPSAHYQVVKTLLQNGKHVYTEKVLATDLCQAAELVRLADEKSLLLCAAPDTFLGAAVQTARYAIDSGLIGEVTSCVAVLQRDAALLAEKFPYTVQKGGGIGIDVGIYYVTALLSILGPASAVCGLSDTFRPNRTHYFTSKGRFGEAYTIEAETLLAATVRFQSGAVGSLHFNSASIRCERPYVSIFGTQGILYLPDPNFFGGEVKVLLKGQSEPFTLPGTHAYDGDNRGLGVADMAWALRNNRPPRANKEMAYHAMELLSGAIESGQTGAFYRLKSSFEKQPGLPRGYMGKGYAMSEPEAALAL